MLRKRSRAGSSWRIHHGWTSSTRPPEIDGNSRIDLTSLDGVLSVDEKSREAEVESNLPMRQLLEATLEHDLIPPVVMEFPSITVGGGISGGAGESSSWKHGLFHRTCRELEVVLACGDTVRASPVENPELFRGIPGSCGTLGIVTAARLRLIPASSYVALTYVRVEGFQQLVDRIRDTCFGSGNSAVEFVDAIMYDPDLGVVMLGSLTDSPGFPRRRFRRARDEWIYIHACDVVRNHSTYTEYVPIRDYVFRYDRGAFWAGRYAFTVTGVPFRRASRFIFDPFLDTDSLYTALHSSKLSHRYLVQDICLPSDSVAPFLEWVDRRIGIRPMWLWPIRPDRDSPFSPAAIETDLVIDVGLWGIPRGGFLAANREIERKTVELEGRKMLYAHVYHPAEEFAATYNCQQYRSLRRKYGADRAFPSLYEKVRTDGSVKANMSVAAGAGAVFRRTLTGLAKPLRRLLLRRR